MTAYLPATTKVSLARWLVEHHLVEQGLIAIGDVAFSTAESRRHYCTKLWDEDDYY